MPLLIDCYNVLHADKPSVLAGLSEATLCVLLAASPWARSGVTVVCDGSPKPHSPSPADVEPVVLVYSATSGGGSGRSADDVIIDLIDKDSAPRRLTVVSDDRTIQKAARRRRARVWPTQEFLKRLARMARNPGAGLGATAPGKPGSQSLTDDQVRRWLAWFGVTDEHPSADTRDIWGFDPEEIDRLMDE